MKIIYFYIYSKQYGSGHFKRAINYKNYFLGQSYNCKIEKIDFTKIEKNKKLHIYDYIFLDITNEKLLKKKFLIKKIVNFINIYNEKVIIIDGLGKYQINNLDWEKCKCVIYPYFFSIKKIKKKKRTKYFVGYEYMIRDLINAKIKIKKKVQNILFTSGGSDLNNSSNKFLSLFQKLNIPKLNLFIIHGIFANKERLKKIKKIASLKKINLKILTF